MRRREFVAAMVSAVAGPLSASAQSASVPLIGFLSSLSARTSGHGPGLAEGMGEGGVVEGTDVVIEYRWADGRYDRLRALATELVGRDVVVIVAASLPAAIAANAATNAVPIVFVSGADPVKFGLVASMNKPGGNATGVFQYFGALGGKRLEILRELAPGAALTAVLLNPNNPNAEDHLYDVEKAARAMGQEMQVFKAGTEAEIEAAFSHAAEVKAGTLLVADDPLFSVRRAQIVALAAKNSIPAIYYSRQFVAGGGLISYGSSARLIYRQAGNYVARILRGAKPADLPVVQPTSFELVINTATARALGLIVPATLLARADEVIQ